MVRDEGGRWDVGRKNDVVYLERVDEGNERLFDDELTPAEARELAELLNKFAIEANDDTRRQPGDLREETTTRKKTRRRTRKTKTDRLGNDDDSDDERLGRRRQGRRGRKAIGLGVL